MQLVQDSFNFRRGSRFFKLRILICLFIEQIRSYPHYQYMNMVYYNNKKSQIERFLLQHNMSHKNSILNKKIMDTKIQSINVFFFSFKNLLALVLVPIEQKFSNADKEYCHFIKISFKKFNVEVYQCTSNFYSNQFLLKHICISKVILYLLNRFSFHLILVILLFLGL